MAEQRDDGFELVLSNRQLLSLFFVVVVFFAAFFSVGYVVGFGHGEGSRPAPELAEAPPPAPAEEEVRLPDSLLMPTEEEAPEPAPAPVRETPKESPRVVATPPRGKTDSGAQRSAAAKTGSQGGSRSVGSHAAPDGSSHAPSGCTELRRRRPVITCRSRRCALRRMPITSPIICGKKDIRRTSKPTAATAGIESLSDLSLAAKPPRRAVID